MQKRFEKCVVLVVLVDVASIDEDGVFCRACGVLPKSFKIVNFGCFFQLLLNLQTNTVF